MRLIEGTTDFELDAKSALAVGKFDGIHRGHREILDKIVDKKKAGMQAVVFTFDPPPAVLFGDGFSRELTTKEEKREIFEKVGIDVLIEFPLTKETASIQPEDFIGEILVKKLKMAYIAAGTDVSFGDKGRGNWAMLQEYAGRFSYEAELVPKRCLKGREISSSYVRREVEQGNMELAGELIGFPYSVAGTVVKGKQFGRTIGMPTVNLLLPENKLLPPRGVYYADISFGEGHYRGVTNIGYKPTVSNEQLMGVETYIYDFSGDLYGREITVKLLHFKRPEMKFQDKQALKEQMEKDIAEGRVYFGSCQFFSYHVK